MMIAQGVSIVTKTWVTLGLVVLALFEFWTAMYVFGRKGKKAHTKLMMRLHRWGGYVFLLYWIWPMVVGLDLLTRLSRYKYDIEPGWTFDGPRFFHAFLAVVVFLLLLLKILFVRIYTNYRQWARTLGLVIAVTTIVIWVIAGWFWLAMMGSAELKGETRIAPPGTLPAAPATKPAGDGTSMRARETPSPLRRPLTAEDAAIAVG